MPSLTVPPTPGRDPGVPCGYLRAGGHLQYAVQRVGAFLLQGMSPGEGDRGGAGLAG